MSHDSRASVQGYGPHEGFRLLVWLSDSLSGIMDVIIPNDKSVNPVV